jgi:hypothetical protein
MRYDANSAAVVKTRDSKIPVRFAASLSVDAAIWSICDVMRRGGAGRILVGETGLKVQLINQSMGDIAAMAEMGKTKEESSPACAPGLCRNGQRVCISREIWMKLQICACNHACCLA